MTNDININLPSTEANIPIESIPRLSGQPLIETIHGSLSIQSLELADKIYEDWKKREGNEKHQREKQIEWIKKVLLYQMIATIIIIIISLFCDIHTPIIIGLISATIIEFIGLMTITITYYYSERSTKSLDVVAKIMADAGTNNSKYNTQKEHR